MRGSPLLVVVVVVAKAIVIGRYVVGFARISTIQGTFQDSLLAPKVQHWFLRVQIMIKNLSQSQTVSRGGGGGGGGGRWGGGGEVDVTRCPL